MISFSLNVVALILGASAVTLQSSDGRSHTGELMRLDAMDAVVQTATELEQVPVDQLLRITNSQVASKVESSITVGLTDGTVLGGMSFEFDDKARVGIVEKTSIELDPRNLHVVRFRSPTSSDPLDKQWDEILKRKPEGDLLVVRKGQKLNFLEGVIRGVSPNTVDFVFDNNEFAVKRRNVEGLIFLTRATEPARPSRVVHTVGAGVVQANAIELRDEVLLVSLVSGDEIRLPMSAVRSVDFAASQIVYLSALEPYKVTVTPRLASAVLGGLASRLIYQPAFNKSLSGNQLSLPAQVSGGPRQYFDNGLALHSRTEMIYRIDEGEYGRLQGLAAIDPDLRQQGAIRLVIEGDDKTLLDADIGPGDAPVPIDVNVEGVRRLKILVDYGDTLDAGDHLNLCEIRLTP